MARGEVGDVAVGAVMRDEVQTIQVVGQRLAVIFNPTAGRRRRQRFAAALASLTDHGFRLRLMATERRGDAERFAAEAAAGQSVDAIVVAGGDGTINEAINGMAGSGLPLGLLPLGTANVLAWELGIGDDMGAAVAAIAAQATRRIHLGRCNGRLFVMMAGVGFDAHVVAAMRPALKRAFGKLAYVYEGLHQIALMPRLDYRVSIDGVDLRGASAIVANGHFYAGRYTIARAARLDASILHACLFARGGRLQAMRYSTAMLFDRLDRLPDLSITPGRAIAIEGPDADPVQADGDIVAHLPAVIEVAPTTLDLFAPRRADGAAAD